MGAVNVPDWLDAELAGIETISDKIRRLDGEGFERADIARILGKRYQHVRNVLEADARKVRAKEFADAAETVSTGDVFRVTVEKGGAIRLPGAVLTALGVSDGEVLSARLEGGELRLAEPVAALRRVQAMLAPVRETLKPGSSVADELIAERRAEARREGRE